MHKTRKIWCANFSENKDVCTNGRAWIHRSHRLCRETKNLQIIETNKTIIGFPKKKKNTRNRRIKYDHKTSFHKQKLWKFIAVFKIYGPKFRILDKNCQIVATKGQILAISEFYQHIHYDFLKRDHKTSLHTKRKKYNNQVRGWWSRFERVNWSLDIHQFLPHAYILPWRWKRSDSHQMTTQMSPCTVAIIWRTTRPSAGICAPALGQIYLQHTKGSWL